MAPRRSWFSACTVVIVLSLIAVGARLRRPSFDQWSWPELVLKDGVVSLPIEPPLGNGAAYQLDLAAEYPTCTPIASNLDSPCRLAVKPVCDCQGQPRIWLEPEGGRSPRRFITYLAPPGGQSGKHLLWTWDGRRYQPDDY